MTASNSDRPRGTGLFYVVALAGSLLSLDTAARFFSARMGINGILVNGFSAELAAVCGIGELTLVACGYAMRHNVRREGKPGAAQLVALAMCTAASFMAVGLDGPVAGGLRAFFGPVLALIALHLALGIEVQVRKGGSTGAWTKVLTELRERVMSRLGLGDDGRKAAERTRDRARSRAARLATATGKVPFREQRLARAVRASGATLDAARRGEILEEVATLKNVTDLVAIDTESPWSAAVPAHVQRFTEAAQRSIEAQRAAAEADAVQILADAKRAAEALREAVQRETGEAQMRVEAQRVASQQQLAAAQAEAAQIRAAADKVAAEERRAADDYRRQVEQSVQQQIEQLIAAARAEAAEIRSAARDDAQVLRQAAGGAAAQRPNRTQTRRIEAPTEAPDAGDRAALAEALEAQWPDEVPSLRSAAAFLRECFGSCSDKRVADAVAALRVRRNGHREAPDAEHLPVTVRINGNHPDLAAASA